MRWSLCRAPTDRPGVLYLVLDVMLDRPSHILRDLVDRHVGALVVAIHGLEHREWVYHAVPREGCRVVRKHMDERRAPFLGDGGIAELGLVPEVDGDLGGAPGASFCGWASGAAAPVGRSSRAR